MLAALLFASLAEAHDLEIHVQVPGADPVWTTLRDVQPGSTHRVEFPVDRRTTYVLTADVKAGEGGYDWLVGFDLSSVQGRGKRARTETIARPTMQSHTGELAQFTIGTATPLEGASPEVKVLHGYQIAWIVETPR